MAVVNPLKAASPAKLEVTTEFCGLLNDPSTLERNVAVAGSNTSEPGRGVIANEEIVAGDYQGGKIKMLIQHG